MGGGPADGGVRLLPASVSTSPPAHLRPPDLGILGPACSYDRPLISTSLLPCSLSPWARHSPSRPQFPPLACRKVSRLVRSLGPCCGGAHAHGFDFFSLLRSDSRDGQACMAVVAMGCVWQGVECDDGGSKEEYVVLRETDSQDDEENDEQKDRKDPPTCSITLETLD